ncbi:MAG: metallophosphoesterase, partial [Bryobacterales bacterium]|nr:metallophosphoesterase [Bryobacterales bacterium]
MLAIWFLRLSLLLLAALSAHCANVERITILHLNDLHARLLPDERGRGGFAHVATAIAAERAKAEHAVVLHAGDMVQGSPVSTIFAGTPVFEVANRLGFDAHCLGNHEFDYGWEKIADFQRVTDAPILAANVLNAQGQRLVPPTAILAAGNLRIGVVGALTARLDRLIKPAQAGPWRAAPLVDSLRQPVAEMQAKTDLVIVLGHLFDDEDEAVLHGLPDVDVMVSGHDHGGRDTELVVG